MERGMRGKRKGGGGRRENVKMRNTFRSHLGDSHWEEERQTCAKNNRNTGGNGLLGNQAVNKQKPKARKQFQWQPLLLGPQCSVNKLAVGLTVWKLGVTPWKRQMTGFYLMVNIQRTPYFYVEWETKLIAVAWIQIGEGEHKRRN